MSQVIVLQHAENFPAGRILTVFRDFGMPIQLRRVWKGDEVPSDLEEIRLLVSLGGPMKATEAVADGSGAFSREIELMKRMVTLDRPVIGIGLGAQLLAHAAGAKLHPLDGGARYGWAPVTFPFPGGTEPIVFGMIDGSPMFHWQSETFDLPKLPAPATAPPPPAPQPPTGNSLLSSATFCKNMAFRFKTSLFGFQYHFELERGDIDRLLASVPPGGAGDTSRDTDRFYTRYDRVGTRLLENFVQFLRAY
jgi:GMP synthase (glutamine-hydrolysing)